MESVRSIAINMCTKFKTKRPILSVELTCLLIERRSDVNHGPILPVSTALRTRYEKRSG
jgi:hypothetical protein